MTKYMLEITYQKQGKDSYHKKDVLIYSSITDLKKDLKDFKLLTNVKSYRIFTCLETDIETGEIFR